MTRFRVTVAIAAVFLGGCGVQFTGGPASTAGGQPVSALTAGASLHAMRRSSGVVGVRASAIIDDGIRVKQGFLHGGYDIRLAPGYVAVEPGVDLGLGEPLTKNYASSIGAYGGLSMTWRFRLFGYDDGIPTYTIYGIGCELVAVPRVGAWMPPESATDKKVYGELSAELGVRFVLASDIFVTPGPSKLAGPVPAGAIQ